MHSCLVLSSPRAGTHLVMAGLLAAGMKEAKALTAEQWQEDISRQKDWRVLDMPGQGHYRFGAHIADPSLIEEFRETDLKAVMIQRDLVPQVRSLKAFYSVIHNEDRGNDACKKMTIERNEYMRNWVGVPGIVYVRYEDLSQGAGWDRIFEHLGIDADPEIITREVIPEEGKPYYRNTLPSQMYYETDNSGSVPYTLTGG